MTINEAKVEMRRIGIVLKKISATGEYRVNFQGGKERTAYYTNDLHDALDTGRDMIARLNQRSPEYVDMGV